MLYEQLRRYEHLRNMSGYKIALMVFIVAATVAAYGESPAMLEEGSEGASWPAELNEKPEPDDSYWGRNLFLFKLMRQLQGDEERYDTNDDLNIDQNWSQLAELKEPDEKKWVTALSTSTGKSTKSPNPRPQPKWKSKKGRGFPKLCYLKLCSFRSPF